MSASVLNSMPVCVLCKSGRLKYLIKIDGYQCGHCRQRYRCNAEGDPGDPIPFEGQYVFQRTIKSDSLDGR